MSLKIVENSVRVSNSLDQLLGVSSRSKLFAYGTTVVVGGLRINVTVSENIKHGCSFKEHSNVNSKTNDIKVVYW